MYRVYLVMPGDHFELMELLKIPENKESVFSAYDESKVARIFSLIFDQINRPISVIEEDYYIDEDYLDLYSNYYVFSYQINSKFSKRVVLVDCSFEDVPFDNYWYNESESDLSDKILAILVIPESSNRHISKAYINPKILLKTPCSKIILSKVHVDILGKRIHMNTFPFRQTDSELLSCSEVSMYGVFDYYYNKNQGFNKERLSSLLKTKEELSRIRGFHYTNGMDVQNICSIFRQKGYETVFYDKNAMFIGFTSTSKTKKLVSMFYPYVNSGYPCLLLVKPTTGWEELGHCITSIGTVESITHTIDDKTITRIESAVGKAFYTVQESEFCTEIITVDDQTCLNYIQILNTQELDHKYEIIGTVIVVPDSIKMEAEVAYYFANDFIAVDPFCSLLVDEDDERFIISIFLVKSTEYVRYRVAHATSLSEKDLYVNCPLPDYVWLCEYSTVDSYTHNLANAELVLDATVARPNLFNSLVLFRIRNYILPTADRMSVEDDLDNTVAARMIFGDDFDETIRKFKPESVFYYS